jgi:protein phosphatase
LKILVLSDIHGNLDALRLIMNTEKYDDILVLGDIVDFGPNPAECFGLLQSAGAKRILGNHDVAASFDVDCCSGPRWHHASLVTRHKITRKLMSSSALRSLGEAPNHLAVKVGGKNIFCVHASPRNFLYGYVSKESAGEIDAPEYDALLLGHTHIQYRINREGRPTTIVNPGSVGLPRGGDPRTAYALLDSEESSIALHRLKYDISSVISEMARLLPEDPDVFGFLRQALSTGMP